MLRRIYAIAAGLAITLVLIALMMTLADTFGIIWHNLFAFNWQKNGWSRQFEGI
jgi:hypothetical protein